MSSEEKKLFLNFFFFAVCSNLSFCDIFGYITCSSYEFLVALSEDISAFDIIFHGEN